MSTVYQWETEVLQSWNPWRGKQRHCSAPSAVVIVFVLLIKWKERGASSVVVLKKSHMTYSAVLITRAMMSLGKDSVRCLRTHLSVQHGRISPRPQPSRLWQPTSAPLRPHGGSAPRRARPPPTFPRTAWPRGADCPYPNPPSPASLRRRPPLSPHPCPPNSPVTCRGVSVSGALSPHPQSQRPQRGAGPWGWGAGCPPSTGSPVPPACPHSDPSPTSASLAASPSPSLSCRCTSPPTAALNASETSCCCWDRSSTDWPHYTVTQSSDSVLTTAWLLTRAILDHSPGQWSSSGCITIPSSPSTCTGGQARSFWKCGTTVQYWPTWWHTKDHNRTMVMCRYSEPFLINSVQGYCF